MAAAAAAAFAAAALAAGAPAGAPAAAALREEDDVLSLPGLVETVLVAQLVELHVRVVCDSCVRIRVTRPQAVYDTTLTPEHEQEYQVCASVAALS